jgi:hypothetical protein
MSDILRIDIFRIHDQPLDLDKKGAINEIKENAMLLYDLINTCEGDAHCLALAKTNLEQAVMWAVKGITA